MQDRRRGRRAAKMCGVVMAILPCLAAVQDENGRVDVMACPRPTCSGPTGCQTPADVDDCRMCCSGPIACSDCCDAGFEMGSRPWQMCRSICGVTVEWEAGDEVPY